MQAIRLLQHNNPPNTVVGSQIVAQTQVETGDGPNKPSTINF